MRFPHITSLTVALIVLAAGCSDNSTQPTPPGIQPEIVNVQDSFEYQIQSVSRYTGTASYTWENTGTTAAVDHSSVVSNGTGVVVVRDANGAEVYSGVLTDSGSFASNAGVPGTWTVQVSYNIFSGTVNFRVQKG